MRRNIIFGLFLATALSTVPVFSASSTIGVATAVSSFSVDNATVTGNADVFEGTDLSTTTAVSDVHLQNGAAVRLATRSAGTVFSDHLALREGAVRVANFENYAVKASQLQIEADSPSTEAVIRMTGRRIEIASIGGTVRVTDGGAMLTRVASGTKMFFQNSGSNAGQTGASPGQSPTQTGAAPAPEKGPFSDHKAFLVTAGICAGAAVVVGAIAAGQGKSPFPGK